jgi:hypothetical protein
MFFRFRILSVPALGCEFGQQEGLHYDLVGLHAYGDDGQQ